MGKELKQEDAKNCYICGCLIPIISGEKHYLNVKWHGAMRGVCCANTKEQALKNLKEAEGIPDPVGDEYYANGEYPYECKVIDDAIRRREAGE